MECSERHQARYRLRLIEARSELAGLKHRLGTQSRQINNGPGRNTMTGCNDTLLIGALIVSASDHCTGSLVTDMW